jgi:hypothetical protein
MTSMTAMTIRMCTQFPVRGKLELMFRPKKPSSQNITRTMMMIQSNDMRFLLLNDLSDATWSLDRVTVGLTAQQDEYAGCDGEQPHNYAQARKTQTEHRDQPVQDEPNSQQQEAYIITDDAHGSTPLLHERGTGLGSTTLVTR